MRTNSKCLEVKTPFSFLTTWTRIFRNLDLARPIVVFRFVSSIERQNRDKGSKMRLETTTPHHKTSNVQKITQHIMHFETPNKAKKEIKPPSSKSSTDLLVRRLEQRYAPASPPPPGPLHLLPWRPSGRASPGPKEES